MCDLFDVRPHDEAMAEAEVASDEEDDEEDEWIIEGTTPLPGLP